MTHSAGLIVAQTEAVPVVPRSDPGRAGPAFASIAGAGRDYDALRAGVLLEDVRRDDLGRAVRQVAARESLQARPA